MRTLNEFYEFMDRLQTVRRTAVGHWFADGVRTPYADSLRIALDVLDALPGGELDKELEAGGRSVTVTIDYERSEIRKDILFLEETDDRFARELDDRHPGFAHEVERTMRFLAGRRVHDFVSDRDGTVNNYCGRYRSSHQSVWNAVWLTRFTRSIPGEPVLLTSAPLEGHGLLSLSAMPEGSTSYAGSKGREYLTRTGKRGAMPFDEERAQALARLNDRIDALLDRPGYRALRFIGSGLQHKYGQTTVARQDIHASIPKDLSDEFLDSLRRAVMEVDPEGSAFGVEDTGKDVEITLAGEAGREFGKGDGIEFLDRELAMDLTNKPCLICGDTQSDLPMVEAAIRLGGRHLPAALFVTIDESLKARVQQQTDQCHFVSNPDVLVTALARSASKTQ